MSDESSLKPCLVLGTGFHHWVLGDTKGYEPLVSWKELLRETAFNMKIPWPDSTGSRLSTQWENMILLAAQNGYFNTRHSKWVSTEHTQQTYRIEAEMKCEAARVLREVQTKYPCQSKRASFPKSEFWGAIVSLNFDTAWFKKQLGLLF